jgi:hypothetical protein
VLDYGSGIIVAAKRDQFVVLSRGWHLWSLGIKLPLVTLLEYLSRRLGNLNPDIRGENGIFRAD